MLFALQNAPPPPRLPAELEVTPLRQENRHSRLDLLVSCSDGEQGLAVTLEYDSDLFDAATIEALAEAFGVVLNRIVAEPKARLSDLVTRLGEAQEERRQAERQRLDQARSRLFRRGRRKSVRAGTAGPEAGS